MVFEPAHNNPGFALKIQLYIVLLLFIHCEHFIKYNSTLMNG